VNQTPGAVGYVELAYARGNRLPYAQVQNRAGVFMNPTLEATTAAFAAALASMDPSTDFRVSITDPAAADAYPIASMTYLLLRKSYDDAAKTAALIKFIWWAETDGQAKAAPLGYAPLPTALRPWIADRLSSITVAGQKVWTASAAR
jgi:phosphate transport system substrate-binding protein